MSDERPTPTPAATSTRRSRQPSITRTPRWVYAFGIIFVVVAIALFLVQHLVFGGFGGHGH